eukprot:210030-Chlamydomonas_euryale.AAC.2
MALVLPCPGLMPGLSAELGDRGGAGEIEAGAVRAGGELLRGHSAQIHSRPAKKSADVCRSAG